MKYTIIPVTPFEQNCALLWCEASGKAAVVDPGGDLERILARVDAEGVALEKILITHAHIDHAGAAGELADQLDLPIEGPQREDAFWIELLPQQAGQFGFPVARTFTPDRWLAQGDRVSVGEETLEVRHCPGHTPGHVIFYHPGERLALVGDVLFRGSIGRTDFPRSDHGQLLRSIREQLLTLDDQVAILPGHGPMTTIGQERRSNPFLN